MSDSLHFQWGFVEISTCPRCGVKDELWVHSGMPLVSNPICTGCSQDHLDKAITQCKIDIRETEESGQPELVEEYKVILSALQVLMYESPYSYSATNIYGERPEKCNACYSIQDSEDNALVDAFNNYGEVVKVHAVTCRHRCEQCNRNYQRNHNLSWRLAQRLPYTTRIHGVRLSLFEPTSQWMCPTCIEQSVEDAQENGDTIFCCDICNLYDHQENFMQFNGEPVCDTCYGDNVTECDDCGEFYWMDNGHDCDNYGNDDEYSIIHNYDYRPRTIFFGHGESKYYLGFELEVEAFDNNRSEGALLAQNELGEHAYMKSDGSLVDGFEIVTHPHTLEAYKELNWSVLDKLRANGYRSWNTETCGLHVHISRTAFGNGDRSRSRQFILSQQMHELRFMKLIYDNQRQVERLAGRPSNHYASFMDRGHLIDKVKAGIQRNGRYSVINTENRDTLEVRIFRGSLRKETVMSALEFVTASVEYTRGLKVTASNKALTWARFVSYVVMNSEIYPNLLDKINKSFENDTITATEYAE